MSGGGFLGTTDNFRRNPPLGCPGIAGRGLRRSLSSGRPLRAGPVGALAHLALAFEFPTGPFFGAGTKPGLRRLSRLRLLTGWDRQMLRDGQADVYRVHAAQCVLLAQKTDDSESKLALLDMARSWQALANQNDKNSQTSLVYETPEPRRQVAQQQQPQPKKG